ncbi:hypothetical protein FQA39_LY08298 [Lamprigera yunnana]|nr:hypothetical protein FQA39_LY08298 [Lamprigera yunnana]
MDENNAQVLSKTTMDFLHTYIKELDVKDYVVNISRGSNHGDNYLGVIAKVQVKTEKLIMNWILKSAMQQEAFRSFLSVPKVYAREVYVYDKVLFEFNRFQKEKCVSKPFKSYAKYHTCFLTAPYECFIMDDMKVLGYKLWKRSEPLDYNHVLLVMREYGRFHALSFAMRDQKPSLFQEISENIEEIFFNEEAFLRDDMLKFQDVQLEKIVKALDPLLCESVHEKFMRFKERMTETIKTVIHSTAVGKYSVVCHGDSWINNFLFKYGNSERPNPFPSDICILDWQQCRLGSPVLDLSYFIFSSTDKKFRDEYYDEMMREYHSSLSNFLIELRSDPKELYPFHVFEEDLRIFSVFGLYMAINILYFVVSDTEEIPDFFNVTSGEDAIEQMNFQSKNIEKFNSRVRGVVLDFGKLNYDFGTAFCR